MGKKQFLFHRRNRTHQRTGPSASLEANAQSLRLQLPFRSLVNVDNFKTKHKSETSSLQGHLKLSAASTSCITNAAPTPIDKQNADPDESATPLTACGLSTSPEGGDYFTLPDAGQNATCRDDHLFPNNQWAT